MKYDFTFIMNSPEIGEAIEQYSADSFAEAWEKWSSGAALWILEQINNLKLTHSEVRKEILNSEPQLLTDLKQVWLCDICIDLSISVIQVVVIGYINDKEMDTHGM